METDRLGEVVDLDEYEGDDSTDDVSSIHLVGYSFYFLVEILTHHE